MDRSMPSFLVLHYLLEFAQTHVQKTLIQFLNWEDLLEKGQATHSSILGFPGGSDGKESTCNLETWVRSLGWEDSLKKGSATHSRNLAWRIPAWRIPWTEEPGRLQSMGSQRVGHNWATFTFLFIELIMPSNHLTLYCSLFLLPSIFPNIRVFSNELALCCN